MNNEYRINIVWSEDDNAYIATCPEFIGLSVVADSREEALKDAEMVLADYIDIYKEDGKQLPKPNVAKEYSGQLRLRLPKSLHKQASEMATEDGISLNQFIVCAVQGKVSGESIAKNLVREVKKAASNPQRITINNFEITQTAETLNSDFQPVISKSWGELDATTFTH